MKIDIKKINSPMKDNSKAPVLITDATIAERKEKVLSNMREANISSLIIYADKEHGGNFEYLTGFIPRFEEALQVLNVDGSSTLILGNENFNKVSKSLIESEGVLCPLFSLPNQPMGDFKPVSHYLKDVAIDDSQFVGLVDWKLLANDYEAFHKLSSIPSYIVEGIKEVVDGNKVVNATQIYIHPEKGARTINNANEIARYEYGSSLASDAILDAMNHLQEGCTELEIGNLLQLEGQTPNVVTISAFGKRFEQANIYPTSKKLMNGDAVALTVSYKGGLSSRSGFAVNNVEELETAQKGYLDNMVIPYYQAYVYWLENLKIGINGHDFYTKFNEFYPQSKYGWELNPGHLTSDEEWLSSPFFENSKADVKSGMIFAVDFIPIMEGYNGVSAESTVAVADETLRNEIKTQYPDLWDRIENRKKYIKEIIGIELSNELLPMTSTLGYYRPFLLNTREALVVTQ
ncbi:Xaa-Pro aminopeptidase [Erysipelothrix inopinata]|uniref:Xaa-Pro aminopeptidase n=1 Tax=Erysipelothrix inopinata TaxID=225084 RepID=A0A7G9S1N5_9FIRM|nr:aminopeptidase P family protein [Erysipelothrix inopinata]QNN61760.1 Xaa-Pro aminopeptidase [Erysipelothrix inopinata]